MRVKTYRGASTKDVLSRIKAELGPDAVILSSRTRREDGVSVAEVTAALEEAPQQPRARQAEEAGMAQAPAPEGWNQWHREWRQVKEQLATLLRPQLDLGLLAPIQRQALEFLEREGVDTDVVMQIFTDLKGRPKASILQPLERIVDVRGWNREAWPQRFHALAGPSGIGKTHALVRMALECKQCDASARVCIVNGDTQRMKSKVVLKHYAELAGLDYREIADPMDAAELVAGAAQWDVVLVDLPAIRKGLTLEDQLRGLGLDAAQDLCVHLALAPHFSSVQLRALIAQYAADKTASLVWTKLDESYSFGAMVNTAWATKLPCSVFSYGSGISGTMCPAKHLALWRMLFKHRLPHEEQ